MKLNVKCLMFTLTTVSSHLQDHVYELHDRCKEDGDFEQVAVDLTIGICFVWKENEKQFHCITD